VVGPAVRRWLLVRVRRRAAWRFPNDGTNF